MTQKIDINSDMGEGFGRWQLGPDEELIPLVPTVNIARGFRAGDPAIVGRVARTAVAAGADIDVHTPTLCPHGGMPNVLEVTHRVRQRLAEEDIEIVDLATAVVGG